MEVINITKEKRQGLSIVFTIAWFCVSFFLCSSGRASFLCTERIKIGEGVYSILAEKDLNYLEYRFCDDLMKVDLKNPFQASGIPFEKMNFEGARFKESFSEVDLILKSKSFILEDGLYQVALSDSGEVPFQHINLDYGYEYESGLILIEPYERVAKKKRFELSRPYLESALDWETIMDLDQKAKRAWNEYVLLMKKKGIHDSKSLREHYFSKGYKSKVFDNFRQSLIVFMESSTISATYGLSLIENFHPFFVQTLLEFSLYSQHRLRYGINPSAIFNKSFKERASYGQVEGLVSYTFLLLNIVTANDKSCLNFGLSPEYSRSLVEDRDFLDHDILDHIITSYKYNTAKNCGTFYGHKFYQLNGYDKMGGKAQFDMGKIIYKKFEEIGNFILKKYH